MLQVEMRVFKHLPGGGARDKHLQGADSSVSTQEPLRIPCQPIIMNGEIPTR